MLGGPVLDRGILGSMEWQRAPIWSLSFQKLILTQEPRMVRMIVGSRARTDSPGCRSITGSSCSTSSMGLPVESGCGGCQGNVEYVKCLRVAEEGISPRNQTIGKLA